MCPVWVSWATRTRRKKSVGAVRDVCPALPPVDQVHASELRSHQVEIGRLRERFELHLTEASGKVRDVQDANRDALKMVRRNKRLESERDKLRKHLEQASAQPHVTVVHGVALYENECHTLV